MKGIIFNVFNQLVEEKFGLSMWQDLIDETKPASLGSYTAAGSYPDAELLAMVGLLVKKTQIPITDILTEFGKAILRGLAQAYPGFFIKKSAKEFLLSVHDYIHVEVKKLYPDADLPSFHYEDNNVDELVMIYRSQRKLCNVAEGLIDGTAQYFSTSINRKQSKCYQLGDDHCRFELQFK